MKKVLVALIALTVTVSAEAQKKNIQSASNSLKYKEYSEALKYIDEALNDPSTKDDPKAWYIKGLIYMNMQNDPGYKADDPYKKAVEPYMKVLEIKPGYESNNVKQGLQFAAYNYYNESVQAYNNKKYPEAYNLSKFTVDIHNAQDGKLFEGNKSFDTVAAGAAVINAYSAYYGKDMDNALPALHALKDNPIEGNASIYLMLADIYRNQDNTAKELEIIEAARAKYPSNENVRNEELNYYIRTNQQDKLLKKLKDAVASEPNNPIYQYNLANAYTNMAFPKDADGNSMDKPENYDQLLADAEAGFKKALDADPDNMGYHYDMGVLYYNQSAEVTNDMNQVTGTSAEDDKKWNALKEKRNALFAKAMPYFEKIVNTFEPKFDKLSNDDKSIYVNSLRAMREMYAKQNMLDKSKELKEKIDAAMQ